MKRPLVASRNPIHVTLKVRRDVGGLPCRRGWKAVREAFVAGCSHEGFRACQFSLQANHIHLIIEAKNRQCLSRGIQGLAIRLARGINRAFGRCGKVFADRYHEHILKTPREVKNALSYVLNNSLRHEPVQKDGWFLLREDCFSSAAWFDGWRKRANPRILPTGPPPVSPAKTWLLREGWRRHGLLIPTYIPPRGR